MSVIVFHYLPSAAPFKLALSHLPLPFAALFVTICGIGHLVPKHFSRSLNSLTLLLLLLLLSSFLPLVSQNAFNELSDEIRRIPDVELQSSLQSALNNINSSGYAAGMPLSHPPSHLQPANQQYSLPPPERTQPPSAVYSQSEITSLVENAVTSALTTARKQWEQGSGSGGGSGGSVSISGGGGVEEQSLLQRVAARVEVLQEQMQAFSFDSHQSFASPAQCEELHRLVVQLETRIAR